MKFKCYFLMDATVERLVLFFYPRGVKNLPSANACRWLESERSLLLFMNYFILLRRQPPESWLLQVASRLRRGGSLCAPVTLTWGLKTCALSSSSSHWFASSLPARKRLKTTQPQYYWCKMFYDICTALWARRSKWKPPNTIKTWFCNRMRAKYFFLKCLPLCR